MSDTARACVRAHGRRSRFHVCGPRGGRDPQPAMVPRETKHVRTLPQFKCGFRHTPGFPLVAHAGRPGLAHRELSGRRGRGRCIHEGSERGCAGGRGPLRTVLPERVDATGQMTCLSSVGASRASALASLR